MARRGSLSLCRTRGDSGVARNPVENPYCRILGIAVPDLASVKDHREANTYSLLIVALLERGEPMTLGEVAERFAEAGMASHERAHLSLTRCKPARAPLYRDGDRYALDVHDDDELGLWLFRLGLRPPQVLAPRPVREAPLRVHRHELEAERS